MKLSKLKLTSSVVPEGLCSREVDEMRENLKVASSDREDSDANRKTRMQEETDRWLCDVQV